MCSVDGLRELFAVHLWTSATHLDMQGLRLTCFSLTHMRTSEWNSSFLFQAFSAAIFARAEPHDPEPITAILCLPLFSGEGGSWGTGEEGRVKAGVVRLEGGSMDMSDMGWVKGEVLEEDILALLLV